MESDLPGTYLYSKGLEYISNMSILATFMWSVLFKYIYCSKTTPTMNYQCSPPQTLIIIYLGGGGVELGLCLGELPRDILAKAYVSSLKPSHTLLIISKLANLLFFEHSCTVL